MSIFQKIYDTTRNIPQGKITTYGEIARKLGASPRTVGWALHANKNQEVPCHRVVDRNGRLAPNFAGPHAPRAQAIGRRAFDGAREQRKRLEEEGIKFKDKMHVDLKKYLW